MSGVFRSIDLPPPPPSPPGECVPPSFGAGGGHTRWGERDGGSIARKTPDTAQCSTDVLYICAVKAIVSSRIILKCTFFGFAMISLPMPGVMRCAV
jgi:hypothetical protein